MLVSLLTPWHSMSHQGRGNLNWDYLGNKRVQPTMVSTILKQVVLDCIRKLTEQVRVQTNKSSFLPWFLLSFCFPFCVDIAQWWTMVSSVKWNKLFAHQVAFIILLITKEESKLSRKILIFFYFPRLLSEFKTDFSFSN